MFVTVSHFHPSLKLAGKARVRDSNLDWHENIRLGLEGQTITNDLAYFDRELILAVVDFGIIQ